MDGQVQYRVNWVFGGIMIGVAVIADCIQVVLTISVALAPLSDLVTVVAEGLIGFFFLMSGVSFMRGKKSLGRILGLLVTIVIEMIPILDALPTLTIDTIYNIHSSRAEDRDNFKEQQQQAANQASLEAAQDERSARAFQHAQAANDNEEQEEYREAA